MTEPTREFDVIVLGSGPAGQKAAIQAAKCGKSVAVVERERHVGGACVHRGTIPSKTLRESAQQMMRLRHSAEVFNVSMRDHIQVRTLVQRMDEVIDAHVDTMGDQLGRNRIERLHGRARFVSPHEIEVTAPNGSTRVVSGAIVVIATGSRPRNPEGIPIDHDNVLDSDSILSMIYLPQSLTILGGGVIGSEYASIFASLGVEVTLVDRAERPVRFMDGALTGRFVEYFERSGGTFHGSANVEDVRFDGTSQVETRLADGTEIRSDKLLVSMGRAANVEGLDVAVAGIELNDRALVPVDEHCRTVVPHIYACGDVAGQPGLASSAMEQGRRAMRHAFGLPPAASWEQVPVGIYSVPEMSSVGWTEETAIERNGSAVIGTASFEEVARGLVAGVPDGLLKIVADPEGRRLLGVHIIGEGATELVHLGQMALIHGDDVDVFVENIFNFPTLAEAYRVAALGVVNRRRALAVSGGAAAAGAASAEAAAQRARDAM